VADANSVVFFNAGEPSRYGHPVAGGDDCTIVALPERVVRALLRPVVPAESEAAVARFRFGHALASPLLARLHFQWLAAARRGGPAIVLEDMTTALLDEAVAAAYRARTEVGAPFRASAMVRRRHRELAEEAKIVINANVATPPSLAELADRFGCSPFHLSRVFRSEAGISLRRYVARLRAALAGAHLARERGTRRAGLTDTALAFGYADHSHFTNSFRAELGMTPSRFRDSFR
jgi:AraC-like DNA-binding protein